MIKHEMAILQWSAFSTAQQGAEWGGRYSGERHGPDERSIIIFVIMMLTTSFQIYERWECSDEITEETGAIDNAAVTVDRK